MTIAATQTTDFTRPMTREAVQSVPNAKLNVTKDATGTKEDSEFSFFGDDGITFWDVLDIINPLQHIPIVNTIYRDLTGDEIDPAMKLAGGTLFGGFVGLGFAAADVAVEGMTGKDIGEHVVALATGDFDHGDGSDTYAKADNAENEAPSPAKHAATQAEQAVAVATSGAALINATANSNTMNSELPAWDSPLKPETATQPETLAPVVATAQTGPDGEKYFPAPRRTNMTAMNAKSVAELRAESGSSATTGSLSAPPQLSPEAMRAAGLTQDMVNEVIQRHSKPKTEEKETKQASATPSNPQNASLPVDKPNSGLENAWLYSSMTQALDKYQAAQTLNTGAAEAVAPVSTRTMQ